MGCLESSQRPPDVAEVTDQPSRASIPPPEPRRKKRKKISLRKKGASQKKAEKSGSTPRTESAKITVIWRRWSIFNSTHDSNKRFEGEAAGPSRRATQSSQSSCPSAESVM